MSSYPVPKQHNGSINETFNNSDYIMLPNSGGGGSTIAQTDARYLRNTGIALSNASTTFNDTVDILGLCTVDNINVSSLVDTSNTNVSGLANLKDITVTGVLTSGNIDATN
jgi:hypothetical protein